MQIDETVHGCPVAVVHRIVRLEILALQVKSGPLPGSRLWLRPVGCAMSGLGNPARHSAVSTQALGVAAMLVIDLTIGAAGCWSDGSGFAPPGTSIGIAAPASRHRE